MIGNDRRRAAALRHMAELRTLGLEKELGVYRGNELTDEERADDQPPCLCPGSTPWKSRHLDRPWPDDMPEMAHLEQRTCYACGASKSRPKTETP